MQRFGAVTELSPTSWEFDHLPDEAFLRQHQMISSQIVPFSPSTLWRRIREKKFPAPVKLSDQITAWRVGDVRAWLRDPAGYVCQPEVSAKRVLSGRGL